MTAKTILITGCSSGIGLVAAQQLKKCGYRVFATARKTEDVSHLQSQGLESVQLDVNNPPSMQQALEYVLKATQGTLDALFNNAGYVQPGAIEDLTLDMNRAQFETNVFGPMELTRLVLPIMRRQGHGRIIQNSSILGIITLPFSGAYSASKFALEGFSRTLRQELRGTNIQLSLLNPGPITTNLRQNAFALYKETLQKETSIHQKVYSELEKSYFHPSAQDTKLSQHPEVIMKKLLHALEAKRPRAHYYIGLPSYALAVFQGLVPDGVLEWVLARIR